ncbi:hypothetical protein MG290_09775 [Flavobacterium sp. CBA20B-1]|uniref:hypothetical protein n=1 Tax=unclassified Flavobacterium TaxID=196869 RepID=UPI002224C4F7|nr:MULTISPECIES: hypothetical protein [unclassified Flavobacterium]WCM41245.1 hypothetical protein MG290_09775 [Flavobacterium sp. CBA20B-1]
MKYYPEFNNYGSWSFGGSYYFQQKDKKTAIYGDYDYDEKPMNGFAFSVRKTFNKAGRFSYITGITLNFNTVYKFSVELPQEDINSTVFTEDFKATYTPMDKRMNFSIPFLVQYKTPISRKVFFNVQTGIDLLYMQSGGADRTLIINDINNNEIPRFYYESYSKSDIGLYQNAVVSPGFYFMFESFMIQTNLVYQKTLISHYEGFMYFDNLKPNGKTLIENKRSGDYLGISLQLFLSK